MSEKSVIRLMELDVKAREMTATRDKELLGLEKNLKRELQELANGYISRIETESKRVKEQIHKKGMNEINEINLKTAITLDDMEKYFTDIQDEICDDLIKILFNTEREENG